MLQYFDFVFLRSQEATC